MSDEGSTYRVTGIDISTADVTRATELITAAATCSTSLEVHLCNAYTLSTAHRDLRLRAALERAHLNLPDGTPVARLSGLRAGPVRGPQLIRAVMAATAHGEVAHYLYGGGSGVASAAAREIERASPGTVIAGVETPPYAAVDQMDLPAVGARATATGASVLWVGLGTPKQDYAVPILAAHFRGPVVPVGAAFDFLAGSVRESPAWLHGSGFEWAHRLAQEPRRLWRRYTVDSMNFFRLVARERMHRG